MHAVTRPVWFALAAAVLFGVSTPLSKVLLGSIGPVTLAGLLYLGAALAMVPFAFGGQAAVMVRNRKNTARLAGAVLFGGIHHLASAVGGVGVRRGRLRHLGHTVRDQRSAVGSDALTPTSTKGSRRTGNMPIRTSMPC